MEVREEGLGMEGHSLKGNPIRLGVIPNWHEPGSVALQWRNGEQRSLYRPIRSRSALPTGSRQFIGRAISRSAWGKKLRHGCSEQANRITSRKPLIGRRVKNVSGLLHESDGNEADSSMTGTCHRDVTKQLASDGHTLSFTTCMRLCYQCRP